MGLFDKRVIPTEEEEEVTKVKVKSGKKSVDAEKASMDEPEITIKEVPEQFHVFPKEDGTNEYSRTPASREVHIKQTAVLVKHQEEEVPTATEKLEAVADEQQEVKETVVASEETLPAVPQAFDAWYQSVDHNMGVFKVYKQLETIKETNTEVYNWVGENENLFASIWLGSEYRVLAIPLFETTIPNSGKQPNFLVRQEDGLVLLKPFSAILDTDTTELTEEEVKADWSYFWDKGLSRCVNEKEAY